VPEHRLAIARRLGDVVRREQREVRPEELLGHIEQPRLAHQAQPERIVRHQLLVERLRPEPGLRSSSQAMCPRASATSSLSTTPRKMA
jgi:hypothetical protein